MKKSQIKIRIENGKLKSVQQKRSKLKREGVDKRFSLAKKTKLRIITFKTKNHV